MYVYSQSLMYSARTHAAMIGLVDLSRYIAETMYRADMGITDNHITGYEEPQPRS